MLRSIPTVLAAALSAMLIGLSTPAVAVDPAAALAALKDNVQSLGPNGEKPAPASAVQLSDAELAKIKT